MSVTERRAAPVDPRPLGPVTLEGTHVRLEPLREAHIPALLAAAQAPEIWRWMYRDLSDEDTLRAWVDVALREEAAGTAYPFVVMRRGKERACHEIIGSTRYMDVRAEHRGCEIGWTWYHPSAWGDVVNPETKYLLMKHAFEDWGAIRVELRTDIRNLRSQAAIRKLGAKFEGVLRHHRLRRDGTIRDTVVFSVTDEDWPAVRDGLLRRIGTFQRQ